MKKVIQKTSLFIVIIALCVCSLLFLGILAPFSAQAGTTGSQIADDSDFNGEEIDLRNWKYERNAGLNVKPSRKIFSFKNPSGGDFALKSLNKTVGHGTIIEMDIAELDINEGSLSLTYGCLNDSQVTKNGKPYWNIMEQTYYKPTEPLGSMQTFNLVDNALKLTFTKPKTTSIMQSEGENSNKTLKFKTRHGEQTVTGDNVELSFGSHLTNNILYNKTLRVYWDDLGGYELSVRNLGSPINSRYKVLENFDNNSIRGAMPGYFGLSYVGGGCKMKVDLADMRIYQISTTDANINPSVPQSKFGALESMIDDYVFMYDNGNFESGALGTLNTMHFTPKHDIENPLVSRKEIFVSDEINEAITMEWGLQFNNMTQNKKFGLVFGMSRLDGDVGAENSSFLYFQKKDDKLMYGLTKHKNGADIELIQPTFLANASSVAARVKITSDGKIMINLNNSEVYSSARIGEVLAKGYLGFSQIGSYTTSNSFIDVEITSLNIVNKYYYKPFTPKVLTVNFDNNEYNVNDLYMKGSQMVVKDGKYVFDGAGENSGFATRMAFSNFDLEYTLFDVKNTIHFDPKVGATFGASSAQGVSFGYDGEDVESSMVSTYESYSKQSYVYFDAEKNANGSRKGTAGMHFIYKGAYKQSLELPSRYNFFKVGYKEKVSVNIKMVEGVMTVGLKLPQEKNFTVIYTFNEFDNNFTTSGYICFWAAGNDFITNKTYESRSFYSIDDIKVRNLDENPNIKENDFISNKVEAIPDYEYTDKWTDDYLLGNRKKDIGGCSSMNIASLATIICGALAIALLKIKR